ncbi:hypothetical protein RDABS01_024727 [Bienertia sinuspersici]
MMFIGLAKDLFGAVNVLWKPIGRRIDWYNKYEENVKNVEEGMDKLEILREDLQARCQQIEEEGTEEVGSKAKNWLENARKLLAKYVKLKLQVEDQRSGRRGLKSVYFRYSHSIKAKQLHEKIEQLIQTSVDPNEISRPVPVDKAKGDIDRYMSIETDSRTIIRNQILDKLEDDNVHVVGLFGNALVGIRIRLSENL